MNNQYYTLVQALEDLKKDGYTLDFNVVDDCIHCSQSTSSLSPELFKIDKVIRFEGATNPDDQAILYAISSEKFDMKGVLVNGYGISSDDATHAIISRLQTHPE